MTIKSIYGLNSPAVGDSLVPLTDSEYRTSQKLVLLVAECKERTRSKTDRYSTVRVHNKAKSPKHKRSSDFCYYTLAKNPLLMSNQESAQPHAG